MVVFSVRIFLYPEWGTNVFVGVEIWNEYRVSEGLNVSLL